MRPFALLLIVLAQVVQRRHHPAPAPPPQAVATDEFTLLLPPVVEPTIPPPTVSERPPAALVRSDVPLSGPALYVRLWAALGLLLVSVGGAARLVRRRRQQESISPVVPGRLVLRESSPPASSPWEWIVQLFGPHANDGIPVVSPDEIKAVVTPPAADDAVLVRSAGPSNDPTPADLALQKAAREEKRFEVYILGIRALARRMIGPHALRCIEVPKGPPELRWRTWLDAPTWEQAQIRATGIRQGVAWRKLIRAYEREGGRWIDHAVETHGGPQTMEVSAGVDHSLEGPRPSAAPRPLESKPPPAPKDLAATKELLRTG